MKHLRITLLWCLLMGPIVWSGAQGLDTKTEGLNRGLEALFLAGLPILALAFLYSDNFSPKNTEIRLGANRRHLVFRTVFGNVLALFIVAFFGGSLLILLLRGMKDPLLLRDLTSTGAISLAASLSIVGVLSAARAWLGKIGLIGLVLFGWLVDQGDLAMKVALPSGHLRSLLGLGQQLPIAGWLSLLCLYTMAGFSLLLLGLRVPR